MLPGALREPGQRAEQVDARPVGGERGSCPLIAAVGRTFGWRPVASGRRGVWWSMDATQLGAAGSHRSG